jgi:hypothetical protein
MVLSLRVADRRLLLHCGRGGLYHADELHTHAAMLDQLQSTIQSINQDLASLVVVIESL